MSLRWWTPPRRIGPVPGLALGLALMLSTGLEVRPASAQTVEYPAGFDEEGRLYPAALGPLSRPITTSSERAQAFFDQGLQMMYAFTPLRAARSFRQAQVEDPDCAMCYWAEAWAWGPYLNGGMGPDDAPRAYENIEKAVKLAGDASNVERALIEAMAVRYAPEQDETSRRKMDSTYAQAMAGVYERYPEDLEAGTLYAESLMLLEPRRGRWDIDNPDVQLIHRVLEETLARDITHPGACHLYVHATEPTEAPEKASDCAAYLGNSIPGASHIQHMPSHTYNRIGRWGESVRGNLAAWHSDLKAEIGEGFAIYPSHNLHMLLFAASMDGQGAIATQAAKDYAKIVPGGSFYRVLTLLRFGRFDEILELDDPPEGAIQRGFWDFGRGYAYLREDEDMGRARVYLERVQDAAAETPDSESFRGHTAASLLGVVGAILEGEILRAEGDLSGAIVALEAAAELEDGLRYDEPEPLNFSVRHWLGDALLEAERYGEAEAVFELALEDHPHNGWSLFGLEEALRAQGRDAEADQVHEAFEAAWARSDTWIRGPVF
ncbi:MAG: hypothetical protein HKN73_11640 [Gemmatimonadetes bacterium]|nr:hypothetical protein [Gemmatimonadota bacterium]